MSDIVGIPTRSEVPVQDRWDLRSLFRDDEAWESALMDFSGMKQRIEALRGGLAASAQAFLAILKTYEECSLLDERLGSYASLRLTEDEGDSASRARVARYSAISSDIHGSWAWFIPELQALPGSFVDACLADPAFSEYAVFLRRQLRFKPHILSPGEEKLLALQAECMQIPEETFSVLTNVDFDFGSLETPEGPKPLTQSTFQSFMRNPDRNLRKLAFERFYQRYTEHGQSLASLYAGSVRQDRYLARVRGFSSARARALFPDAVPEAVYDTLVSTINANLEPLHAYYRLRQAALGLPELRHYDVYVPLSGAVASFHSYEDAVDIIHNSLAPLGSQYVDTLRAGLLGGWVDRYENKGKHSGAFSAGGFTGDPYILMNYKSDVMRDVFTLAHEGGHSMHSWYAARANPFLSYSYSIFEAEVASTFNEQLVFRHLYDHATDDATRIFLLLTKIDDLIGTLYRQTMFAEFEQYSHAMLESGEALTLENLRSGYRALLVKYFGPTMILEDVSDLEGLRIPHFYGAFYVYKYATGISASIALARRVLQGGDAEREDYFRFLRSGGSRFPIEALALAGVDMSTPEPIQAACSEFEESVKHLAGLLKVDLA